MTKSSGRGKENFALRGILIPFDVRLGVAELCASLYIFLTPLSSLSRDAVRIPCRISRWLPFRRETPSLRAPIADSMKVRITCASAPIRLRSWNNRLQLGFTSFSCSLRWNFCWRYVTGLVMVKSWYVSVRQNFSTYPSISYIYSA